jgi:hypothetical protein
MTEETFLEARQRKSKGQRGKRSEDKVSMVLSEWKSKHPRFDYDRLVDARAAGRVTVPQVADFMLYLRDVGSCCLEVKEVKTGYRLKKFVQLPRMERRALAGCSGFVLVHFMEHSKWVVVDIGWLALRKGQASWDLADFKQYLGPKAALQSFINLL